MAGMRRLGLTRYPSPTCLFLAKAGDGRRNSIKRKVIVRPMAGFGLPDYVRVSVSKAEENAQFLAALAEALAVFSPAAPAAPQRGAEVGGQGRWLQKLSFSDTGAAEVCGGGFSCGFWRRQNQPASFRAGAPRPTSRHF